MTAVPLRRFFSLTVLVSCAILTGPSPRAQTTPHILATFHLEEFFGVAWPDQPIEFRYDGGKPSLSDTRMLGPDGAEIPYQWISSCSDTTAAKGCILIRSRLPGHAKSA